MKLDIHTPENTAGKQPLRAPPVSVLYVEDEEVLLRIGKAFLE